MGFFQDLKQDLSQTVNDLGTDDGMADFGFGEDGVTATEDLFGESSENDFADLEAMLKKGVAELGDAPVEPEEAAVPDLETMLNAVDDMPGTSNVIGFTQEKAPEQAEENILESVPDMGVEAVEEIKISEADAEMEQLLNEVEQNIQEPSYMDAAPAAAADDFGTNDAASTDTAVITAGMSITGDVTSSGNMDLIGNITGNIEIFGKLNVTGGITGNSSAAEIYAESAQINGEVRSKGSVKIGQSSVVIGNIFATSAVIAGAVKGDIDVHGPVILDTSAIVMGNIKSKSVQINNGAVIEGMCSQCYADVSPTTFFNDVKKNRGNKK